MSTFLIHVFTRCGKTPEVAGSLYFKSVKFVGVNAIFGRENRKIVREEGFWRDLAQFGRKNEKIVRSQVPGFFQSYFQVSLQHLCPSCISIIYIVGCFYIPDPVFNHLDHLQTIVKPLALAPLFLRSHDTTESLVLGWVERRAGYHFSKYNLL